MAVGITQTVLMKSDLDSGSLGRHEAGPHVLIALLESSVVPVCGM